ncbi:MAG: hypothetical protein JNN17_01415 [Verrucomicrobiaceae bacterium]|nr:hypothetical protein [Verrucomicrobiaceae bacterium]
MNRRNVLLLPIVGVTVASSQAQAAELDPNDYVCLRYCYLNGLRYTFAISKNTYQKLPTWTALGDAPPPVSSGNAYSLAKTHLDTIKIPENYGWDLERISLDPLGGIAPDGKWVWVVSFRYFIKGPSTGIWPRMNYIVTMDGKLVEPIVDKDKKS